jgi:hypothetical protein
MHLPNTEYFLDLMNDASAVVVSNTRFVYVSRGTARWKALKNVYFVVRAFSIAVIVVNMLVCGRLPGFNIPTLKVMRRMGVCPSDVVRDHKNEKDGDRGSHYVYRMAIMGDKWMPLDVKCYEEV